MKLNWAERWAVDNPLRVVQQRLEIRWMGARRALRPGAVVLEVGCGRGAGAGLILKKFRPSVLQAMDLDLEMIQRARGYLPPEEQRQISFYVGDVLHLPCPAASLDALFAFGVLHHVDNWREGLGEICRVLKPGGIYFLEEIYPSLYQNFLTKHILLHPKENRFSSRELKEALKSTGFALENYLEAKNLGIFGLAIKSSQIV